MIVSNQAEDEQKLGHQIALAGRLAREQRLDSLDEGIIASIVWNFHRASERGDAMRSPEAYLSRSLRNARATLYREDARWARAFQSRVTRLSDFAVDPSEQAANREIVMIAQSLLSPAERFLFWLLHVEGLSQRQAAKRLGVSLSRLHRFLARTRDRLRDGFACMA